MITNIKFSRTGLYGGRNGNAPMHGLELMRTNIGSTFNIMLSPINSRGPAASTFYEIPKEDIPKVIQGLTSAMGQGKPLYFHVSTHDTDMGSLGIIHGRDDKELNTALRTSLHRAFNAEAVAFEEVKFGFWQQQHSEEVTIRFTREGDDMEAEPEEQTILLTYTFMQP
jgi:hypothetical protein